MLSSRLTDYFCEQNNINLNKAYNIEKINANQLITKDRIDLIAKLKYIEHKEKGYDLTFIKELYTAHIEAFSHGTFIEPGNDDKNSIEKYFETFDFLIDSIKNHGFDTTISIIPVGSNNAIMDGAHRVAIAAYFNLEVPIIRFENIFARYDTSFFQDRLLDQKYLDYLVAEYCKIKKDLYVACVWSKALDNCQLDEVEEMINSVCKVVYMKRVKLSYRGLNNLIIQIYSAEDWIGCIENDFSGEQRKTNAYGDKEFLTVYVLECDSHAEILKLKQNIRDSIGIGKHAIHITDTYDEVIRTTNLLLNQNSINFLNTGRPTCNIQFNRNLNQFKNKLINRKLSLDDFVIDLSGTLTLYGLGHAQEVNFLTISNQYEIIDSDYVKDHQKCIEQYKTTVDNLILNPDHYFVYNDFKFLKLSFFRKANNKNKNFLYIKLIGIKAKENNRTIHFFNRVENKVKRKIRNAKNRIKIKIIKVTRKHVIYKSLRNLYHFFRRIE